MKGPVSPFSARFGKVKVCCPTATAKALEQLWEDAGCCMSCEAFSGKELSAVQANL